MNIIHRIKLSMALPVMAVIALTAHSQVFLTNGLISFYPLNGNANDVWGTNNGTDYGATLSTNRFGIPNAAYYFNGSTAYVSCGNSPQFNFASNQDFSITVWMQSDGDQSGKYIVGKYDNRAGAYGVGTSGNTTSYAFLWGSQSYSYSGNHGNVSLNDGRWHQLGVIFQRSGTLSIYRDGIFDAQDNFTNVQFGAVSNSYPLLIGAISAGQNFGGSISDVRIYGRALATNEIQQLYQFESKLPPISSVSQALCLNLTNLVVGGSYQIEASGNLFNWTNYGSPFVATSTNMAEYVNATASQGFFKVTPSP